MKRNLKHKTQFVIKSKLLNGPFYGQKKTHMKHSHVIMFRLAKDIRNQYVAKIMILSHLSLIKTSC